LWSILIACGWPSMVFSIYGKAYNVKPRHYLSIDIINKAHMTLN
jgi:hypothetical protein